MQVLAFVEAQAAELLQIEPRNSRFSVIQPGANSLAPLCRTLAKGLLVVV